MQYKFWLLLSIILLFAATIRLYKLDTYPLIFNQDEIVLGYDAWNIWLTGHDHHGQYLPIFFRTFNDYVPPVANYIAAPFVGLLGLSQWSTRLPIALFSILTILLVALLGKNWFNYKIGLIAALFLTIEPWHINYSRIAFPASFVPFFTVLSLYSFTQAITKLKTTKKYWQSISWFTVSALSFALLTSTYPPLKLQAPLLIATCLIASLPFIWKNRSRIVYLSFFWWLTTYIILITPLCIEQINNWDNIQIRYESMSIFHRSPWIPLFFEQYIKHYDPSNLFFYGLPGGFSVHPFAIGELFWLELPLWILAIIGLSQKKHLKQKMPINLPILTSIWFITFPVASGLTDMPHEIRSYNFLPLPELLAGYGVIIAWEKLKNLAVPIACIATLILILFVQMFLANYFRPLPEYPDQFPYNMGLQEILTQTKTKINPCDTVWIDSTNQPYIYYLFFTQYNPHKIQPIIKQMDETNTDINIKIGQVRFGNPDTTQTNENNNCKEKASNIYWITKTQNTGQFWKELSSSYADNNIPLWHLNILNNP